MSGELNTAAIVDHARGILAERFGVGIKAADEILCGVARSHGQEVPELAAAVVASCTSDACVLPRALYDTTAA
jgi:hypothetical protein